MATEFLAGFTHVFVPGAADASVLLCLHGTGGDERDLLDLGRALRPDAALLAPRGRVVERDGTPRGSSGASRPATARPTPSRLTTTR